MYKSLVTPSKYYQGRNIVENLFYYIKYIGNNFTIIIDQIVFELIGSKIKKGFLNVNAQYEFVLFNGKSTEAEADRIADIVKNRKSDAVIGVGGGKSIDTSKLVSNKCNLPLVVIPTSAASDAPCSAASVVYDEGGKFLKSLRMKKNPDIVIVDTMIIAKAPVRLFVAGMGDAYATYYEARACHRSGAINYTGGKHTESAYALAKLCNEILLKFSVDAKESVEKKEWSEALEKVVEANIYLSGVGFENNGCAIAHAIYNGMTGVLNPFTVLHGEGVAFGTIVQLVTEYMVNEEWNDNEWTEVVEFYKSVGLPLSLADLGVKNISDSLLYEIATETCDSGPNAHKMSFVVTPEVIYKSLLRIKTLFN